ncbi:hypothetical protein C2S52_022423 [Perilla frutescens var. hirtella]|nr:hypothetical protein C2S52_022423 [Perilla frutescens var. hirtella]
MELHINWNTPTNTVEIIQSLCKSVELVKSFTAKLEKNSHTINFHEFTSIVRQLEEVVRGIGENLSLIPLSTYGNHEYAEWAAKALSKDMKDVSFAVSPSRGSESKQQPQRLPSREEVETDLYSLDVDASAMNLHLSDTSQSYVSANQERSMSLGRNGSKNLSGAGSSLMAFPQLAQYVEPLYDTFFCPLTKKVMEDPVTIESGVTYEREGITKWFDRFADAAEIVCPKSGQSVKSRTISSNVALKATIDEWKERNEAARIKVARAALSLASTDNMVLEAIDDLRSICKSKPYNKVQIRSIGMLPLLAKFLEYRSRSIRFVTLELLRQLAEDDEEGKDAIIKTVDISTIIKMLSSNHTPVRHASASLLLELSKCQSCCYKIGTVAGGILMLIRAKYRQSTDESASETADQILKNLEILPDNIKLMAENGYWEPLLAHLVEGSEEMKMEMSSYLGEIVLGPDSMAYVAERASPALIQMVQSGNSLTRNAAFKALKQISCYHPNARILVEAGIMQIMVEEMLTRTINNEPMDSKSEAAAILANIIESGLELENFPVSTQGHTMASDYIVYNIIYRIKSTSPDDLNINFIRILLCLIKFPKASATIVSIVKETEASYNLIELINTTNEELEIASIKLLISLSSFMGHTLSDRLCKTQGQPGSLIKNPTEITRITEKHAISANFLSKLPHQNLALNLALVNSNTVPTVIKSISQIQMSGTRSSRHATSYFEGLVGVLVRLTTTLYDHQILTTARTHNFVEVLTELLTRSFTDEVQKLSAVGLENLSRQSIALSRPPNRKRSKILKLFFFRKCISIKLSKEEQFSLCPIHGGVCSSQETFCLLDAEAVERLLACLDHENVEVIEAALSALSSLLDDKVNVDNSVSLLSEKHAIPYVLNVVKEHKEEAVWQKAFWVIDKFLMKGGDVSLSNISQDRLFPATLVSAFHHGDDHTRQMAENILRRLNKMPDVSNTMSFEDFVGNGSLKELLPRLLDEGWDDVPTLKVMNSDDMDDIGLTRQHKDALEIRSYLHDRALMQYGDQLEASGIGLPELLGLSNEDLSSQFGMKRGHIARFMNRSTACAPDPLPESYTLPARRRNSLPSRNNSIQKSQLTSAISNKLSMARSSKRSSSGSDFTLEQSMASFKIKDGYVFKGIVASMPAESRACGCVEPPPVVETVAAYSTIENISVQKLTPEYKIGMERLIKSKTPPMKASELWREKPAILVCIRRPGCIMCRAEAHQLYSKKPIFDALGIQLFAVLHEHIESEVKDFWPRYWGGAVLYDRGQEFFKALGGGKLLKDKFISGFLLNPRAIANYRRAKASGVENNFKGEGEIKGGLYIVGKGKSGIAYQFIERNFGDWAPPAEVIDICTRIQNQQNRQLDTTKSLKEAAEE